MNPTELIILGVAFGAVAFFSLGWMLWNLIHVVRTEGLSADLGKRMSQTKQILLKPALLFFAVGGLSSAYLLLRGGAQP